MKTQEAQMTCYCHFCGDRLRFQISRAGQAINCFNCSMETVLFIPGLPAPYPEDDYQLVLRELAWGPGTFGGRQLLGVLINQSKKNLDWVRIEFIVYNKEGVPIGTTSDCLIGVPAGKVWKFQAPVAQADAAHASEPIISCEYGKVNQLKRPTAVATASSASIAA